MDNVIKQIDIDLYSPASYEVIYAQQGDNNSRVIELSLYDKGEAYCIPESVLVQMEGHRGDGSPFFRDDNCAASGSMIRATLDSDILYAHGTVEAKIVLRQPAKKESGKIYSEERDTILSTIPFRIHVQKNPCDKKKLEGEKRSLIDFLIQKFREVKEALSKHMDDKGNPHEVTKAQVGLGNADNTADKDKYVASADQLTTVRAIDGIGFNGTEPIVHYCICPTGGNTAAKTANLPHFQLTEGARAAVLFQYSNTAANPTLNISGTGARPIHYNGTAVSLANATILRGCCELIYDGLGHWLLTGRHTLVKGASETAYRDGLVSLTPDDIGASPSSHTHNYAGSASPGGSAISADKLGTDAGSTKRPVYFKNGVPIACEDISNYKEVTQAEYVRLTDSEKEDVVFYITDSDNSIPTATDTEKGLVIVDKALSLTSENPVQNKAIKAELDRKVDKASGKGLSTNDYTTAEKTKLEGIEAGANHYSLPPASASTRGGVKIGYTKNSQNYPVQLSEEKMFVNVPWTDTNTTYPLYFKTIDKDFQTKFRTQTKGSPGTSDYISAVRSNTDDNTYLPRYGAGLAWGRDDTHGYLNVSYSNPYAYIGGGNADRLNWVKQLAFMDSNVASATRAGTVFRNNDVDLSAASFDQNKWYPVTGTALPRNGLHSIRVYNYLDGGAVNWSTHSGKSYSCDMELLVLASGYGTTHAQSLCLNYECCWTLNNVNPAGYSQMGNSSIPVLWLRGGGRYHVTTDWDCTWTPRAASFSSTNQSVAPSTSNPGISINKSSVYANLNGNATSATKATQDGNGNAISSTYVKKSGDTLSGALQVAGESKFHQGAYTDPWPSHSCAIKATGDIGVTGTVKTSKMQVSSRGGNWIEGMALSNASISISNQNSATGYHPILAGKTKSNHIWNIGTIMDRAGFYGFKSGRTENNRDWALDIDVTTGAVSSTGSITAPSFIGNATSATNADTVDGKHASYFLPASGGTVSGTLKVTGDMTMEGNVRIKKASSNYGSIINIGDGNYIQISEETDDVLTVKAKQININSTNANSVYINGEKAVRYKILTQAEYNALPSSKNSNGVVYYITN